MPLRSAGLPEAEGLALLEQFDGFAQLRSALSSIADGTAEWAGLPMPLDGQALVIEPSFPMAKQLMDIGAAAEEKNGQEIPEGVRYRNSFWSKRWRTTIYIWEESDGRVRWGPSTSPHGLPHLLHTLDASAAWGIEQEARALQVLGTLLPHHKFKAYLLTGMILEISDRSGVAYLFRKLRPTVAISMSEDRPRILAALCLHPIGYYDDSWAGAMCPTDDVIAHLMLCRADEHMFWKRANQHPPDRPQAGLQA